METTLKSLGHSPFGQYLLVNAICHWLSFPSSRLSVDLLVSAQLLPWPEVTWGYSMQRAMGDVALNIKTYQHQKWLSLHITR